MMSNYLYYILLGYAAGLITAIFIEITLDKKYKKIEERLWKNDRKDD